MTICDKCKMGTNLGVARVNIALTELANKYVNYHVDLCQQCRKDLTKEIDKSVRAFFDTGLAVHD